MPDVKGLSAAASSAAVLSLRVLEPISVDDDLKFFLRFLFGLDMMLSPRVVDFCYLLVCC